MKIGGCISEKVWNEAEEMENAMLDFRLSDKGKNILKNGTDKEYDNALDEYLKEKGFINS